MRRGFALLCASAHLVALMSIATSVEAINPFVETQTLTIANPSVAEDLGFSLDVDDGLLIAGAINTTKPAGDVGSAYVYRRSAQAVWSPVAQLTASDGGHNDRFGQAVALDGEYVVVGADGHDHPSTGTGAAYFYHRISDSIWGEITEYPAPPTAFNYGSMVGLDGDVAAVVGTFPVDFPGPGPNGQRSFVDVMRRSTATTWSMTQRIEFPTLLSRVTDVALQDGTLMIGGSQKSSQISPAAFSVDVYEDSPSGLNHTATLLPSPNPVINSFGYSLALQQDRLLIGAPGESTTNGAAYVFERNSSGDWVQAARLFASDFDERSSFGEEVGLDGDFAFVSSADSTYSHLGSRVNVFQRDSLGMWNEIAKLHSPNDMGVFGWALSAYDGQAIISSGINTPGAIHIFSPVPEPASLPLVALAAATVSMRRLMRITA